MSCAVSGEEWLQCCLASLNNEDHVQEKGIICCSVVFAILFDHPVLAKNSLFCHFVRAID